ncbi:MAG TPA: hypothetical protein VJ250_01235 [Nitrososphaeraceae archaeon]|jgi:hypothetical protein|nr:hypothetical protein [Nitrososphaeraceae archaeon]
MRKEFIVAKIESPQEGSQHYVYVTFSDEKEYRDQAKRPQSQFGPGVGAFNSMEDLMKNMPKIMANMPGLGGGQSESPTVKLSMREYEDMNIKVGDKVYFDIRKQDDDVNR